MKAWALQDVYGQITKISLCKEEILRAKKDYDMVIDNITYKRGEVVEIIIKKKL